LAAAGSLLLLLLLLLGVACCCESRFDALSDARADANTGRWLQQQRSKIDKRIRGNILESEAAA
jgi:hypothetical protein